VLLHEFTEDEDDPLSTAFKLFDKGCWGTHPLAQPVIGTRRNLERFTRDDLVDHVGARTTRREPGGRRWPGRWTPTLLREAEAAFGAMPAGRAERAGARPGTAACTAARMAGSSQSHLVLGFPVPPMQADDPTAAWPPRCWARA
jgi:hypothetical protein